MHWRSNGVLISPRDNVFDLVCVHCIGQMLHWRAYGVLFLLRDNVFDS